jgi:hypothetical protein
LGWHRDNHRPSGDILHREEQALELAKPGLKRPLQLLKI